MSDKSMSGKSTSNAAIDIGAIRQQLLHRRAEILSVITKVDAHVGHRDEPLAGDSGERALELENLDALFAIDRATRCELRQINDALERINIGQYGSCSECGKPIGTARLSALLHVDTCIDCAQRLEAAPTTERLGSPL